MSETDAWCLVANCFCFLHVERKETSEAGGLFDVSCCAEFYRKLNQEKILSISFPPFLMLLYPDQRGLAIPSIQMGYRRP